MFSIVPVSAVLRLENGHSYALGADIVLQCDVDGSPTPNVTWYKNDVLLEASNRIQITGKLANFQIFFS